MTLVLDSLEIKNFRAFKHLRIEKLGRVNLIVGKNNVGKTSLLEALALFASKGEPFTVYSLLKKHGELPQDAVNDDVRLNSPGMQEVVDAFRYLFHGREDVTRSQNPIQIGPAQPVGAADDVADNGAITISVTLSRNPATNRYSEDDENTILPVHAPLLQVGTSLHSSTTYILGRDYYIDSLMKRSSWLEGPHFTEVGVNGLSLAAVEEFWDRIAVLGLEDDVLAALRIIAPEIERIILVGHGKSSGFRVPFARLRGMDRALPLGSLGEGMNRMLGIALALVNAKDGMLLIDEVDTGLHYSVLPDLWRLIFEVAHRLNVQVFATTHSKDCLEAFQYAAEENTEEEGVLIRLENRKAGVGAVTFDEEELAIVTRERIEVR